MLPRSLGCLFLGKPGSRGLIPRRFFRQSRTKVEENKNKLGRPSKKNSKEENSEFSSATGSSASIPPVSALFRPFLWTVGFTAASFGSAVIFQYENMRLQNMRIKLSAFLPFGLSEERAKYGEIRRKINRIWNDLHPGQRVFLPILFFNGLVFAGWQLPFMTRTMIKYFTVNPNSKNLCLPLLLSSFSHQNWIHFGLNMYVLHSFCGPVVQLLGPEQFAALYLSTGVIASFGSLAFRVMSKIPGLSLGASGSLYGVVGFFATAMPEALFQIVFLPMFTFTAGSAIKCLICFDTVGLVAGFKLLDHAAHLSGGLSGIWWAAYGGLVWNKREILMKYWHENVRKEK